MITDHEPKKKVIIRACSRKRKSSENSNKPDIFESHICIKTYQFIPSVHAKKLGFFLRERAFTSFCGGLEKDKLVLTSHLESGSFLLINA